MFYPDYETYGLILIAQKLLGTPQMSAVEMKKLETFIRERNDMVRLGVKRCPSWFMEELLALDSKLRAWWDAWKEEWVIDRLQDEGFYATIIHFKPIGEFQLNRALIETMKANDMQRYPSAEAYLASKRAKAEEGRKKQEEAHNEKVLAAVDSLSSKRLKEFIAVTEAVQSGDTIQAGGDDLKFLERCASEKHAAQIRGEDVRDNTDAAINPGMDPRIYKRTPRKELS